MSNAFALKSIIRYAPDEIKVLLTDEVIDGIANKLKDYILDHTNDPATIVTSAERYSINFCTIRFDAKNKTNGKYRNFKIDITNGHIGVLLISEDLSKWFRMS